MTEKEALVGLNLVRGIGSNRLKKLLEYFQKPQNIIAAKAAQLKRIEGIGEEIATNITHLKKEDIEKEFDLIQKHDLEILTLNDTAYPENLKNIYDPPPVLYIKGTLSPQDKLSIAIVGSRRASFYGLNSAEKFAYELASMGFTVVSGLAYGIDTQAHKGALKAGNRTIAVLGSGLAKIYPAENKKLAGEIAQHGAVISEFPIQEEPRRQNFPCRNRVISGLSMGVLVVEAARNSGALITADFSLEQGRDVFALPGKIDSQTSFGTNSLIKQGAKLVASVEDILEELNLTGFSGSESAVKQETLRKREEVAKISDLTPEESLLYNSLSNEPLQFDDLVDKLKLETSLVIKTLFTLEMKKVIRQFPGKQFARNTSA